MQAVTSAANPGHLSSVTVVCCPRAGHVKVDIEVSPHWPVFGNDPLSFSTAQFILISHDSQTLNPPCVTPARMAFPPLGKDGFHNAGRLLSIPKGHDLQPCDFPDTRWALTDSLSTSTAPQLPPLAAP